MFGSCATLLPHPHLLATESGLLLLNQSLRLFPVLYAVSFHVIQNIILSNYVVTKCDLVAYSSVYSLIQKTLKKTMGKMRF